MKKILIALLLLSLSANMVFASYVYFADEDEFADWYESSALTMLAYDVMRGYDDGEFKADENINRAQLAVILDRFTENVLHEDLADEPFFCLEYAAEGLVIYLQDNTGGPVTEATIASTRGGVLTEGSDESIDPGVYSGLEEGNGQYVITISKEGYNDHFETVVLERGDCHVSTQYKTITLFPNP